MAHQLVGVGEFVGGVVGEVLVTQDLGRGEPQLDHLVVVSLGIVVLVAIGRVVIGVDGDRDREFLDGLLADVRSPPLEEHGERPVVERDVLHPADQGRATHPVRRGAIGEAGFAERGREGVGAARRHTEPEPAQHLGERHGDVGR